MALAVRTTWKPRSQVVDRRQLERMRDTARAIARELGHTLGVWENDTPVSSVTQCLVCEDFAAVDNGAGEEYCGHVLYRPCAGPVIY